LPRELEKILSKRNLKGFLKDKVGGPLKLHHEFRVSMSDCPNACSRPQITDIGLLGACVPEVTDEECSKCEACIEICGEDALSLNESGPVLDKNKCLYCGQCVNICPSGSLKKEMSGYRIQIGGKLGRHPRLATELPLVFNPEEAIMIIDKCLDFYQDNCRKGERLGEILSKKGIKELERRFC